MSDFINEPKEMEPVEIEGTEETAGEVTDSTEETSTAETVSKFRELTSNRILNHLACFCRIEDAFDQHIHQIVKRLRLFGYRK